MCFLCGYKIPRPVMWILGVWVHPHCLFGDNKQISKTHENLGRES